MTSRAPLCPVCKKPVLRVDGKAPSAPFCSDRCQMVDLQKWLGGAYALPAQSTDEEADALAIEEALSARSD